MLPIDGVALIHDFYIFSLQFFLQLIEVIDVEAKMVDPQPFSRQFPIRQLVEAKVGCVRQPHDGPGLSVAHALFLDHKPEQSPIKPDALLKITNAKVNVIKMSDTNHGPAPA